MIPQKWHNIITQNNFHFKGKNLWVLKPSIQRIPRGVQCSYKAFVSNYKSPCSRPSLLRIPMVPIKAPEFMGTPWIVTFRTILGPVPPRTSWFWISNILHILNSGLFLSGCVRVCISAISVYTGGNRENKNCSKHLS